MTLDQDLEIKSLLADLDAALAAAGNDTTQVQAPRALIEQVRSRLTQLATPTTDAGEVAIDEALWVQQSWDALAPDLQTEPPATTTVQALAQGLLRSMQQEIDQLRQGAIAPIQSDLESLRQQRQILSEEIAQLENQRQYYQSLAQQQANQEQIIGDFLQQVRDRLQTSITDQVSQLVARKEAAPSSQDLTELDSSASSILEHLQTTLNAITSTLQSNSQRYEEALNAALERMHVLGEESEAVLDHWLSRLASALGRDLPADEAAIEGRSEATNAADERSSAIATSLALSALGGGAIAAAAAATADPADATEAAPLDLDLNYDLPTDDASDWAGSSGFGEPEAAEQGSELTTAEAGQAPDALDLDLNLAIDSTAHDPTADLSTIAPIEDLPDSEADFRAEPDSLLAPDQDNSAATDDLGAIDDQAIADQAVDDQTIGDIDFDALDLPPLTTESIAAGDSAIELNEAIDSPTTEPAIATEAPAPTDSDDLDTSDPTWIGSEEDIFSDVDAIFRFDDPVEPETTAPDDSASDDAGPGDWDPLAAVTGATVAGVGLLGVAASAEAALPPADLPIALDAIAPPPSLDYGAEPDLSDSPPLPDGQSPADIIDAVDATSEVTNLDLPWQAESTATADLSSFSGGGGSFTTADGLDLDGPSPALGLDLPSDLSSEVNFETIGEPTAAPEAIEAAAASEFSPLAGLEDWSVEPDLEAVAPADSVLPEPWLDSELTGDADLAEDVSQWDQIAVEAPDAGSSPLEPTDAWDLGNEVPSLEPDAEDSALAQAFPSEPDPSAGLDLGLELDSEPELPPLAAELASESEDLGGDLRAELAAWQQPSDAGVSDDLESIAPSIEDSFWQVEEEEQPIESSIAPSDLELPTPEAIATFDPLNQFDQFLEQPPEESFEESFDQLPEPSLDQPEDDLFAQDLDPGIDPAIDPAIELEPELMSAFDGTPDTSLVAEETPGFEGSWSDEPSDLLAAESAAPADLLGGAADDDLGLDLALDVASDSDLGAIDLSGNVESLPLGLEADPDAGDLADLGVADLGAIELEGDGASDLGGDLNDLNHDLNLDLATDLADDPGSDLEAALGTDLGADLDQSTPADELNTPGFENLEFLAAPIGSLLPPDQGQPIGETAEAVTFDFWDGETNQPAPEPELVSEGAIEPGLEGSDLGDLALPEDLVLSDDGSGSDFGADFGDDLLPGLDLPVDEAIEEPNDFTTDAAIGSAIDLTSEATDFAIASSGDTALEALEPPDLDWSSDPLDSSEASLPNEFAEAFPADSAAVGDLGLDLSLPADEQTQSDPFDAGLEAIAGLRDDLSFGDISSAFGNALDSEAAAELSELETDAALNLPEQVDWEAALAEPAVEQDLTAEALATDDLATEAATTDAWTDLGNANDPSISAPVGLGQFMTDAWTDLDNASDSNADDPEESSDLAAYFVEFSDQPSTAAEAEEQPTSLESLDLGDDLDSPIEDLGDDPGTAFGIEGLSDEVGDDLGLEPNFSADFNPGLGADLGSTEFNPLADLETNLETAADPDLLATVGEANDDPLLEFANDSGLELPELAAEDGSDFATDLDLGADLDLAAEASADDFDWAADSTPPIAPEADTAPLEMDNLLLEMGEATDDGAIAPSLLDFNAEAEDLDFGDGATANAEPLAGLDPLDLDLPSFDEAMGEPLLSLDDVTANPLEISSLDQALDMGMAAFELPNAPTDGSLDPIALDLTGGTDFDPTALDAALTEFGESSVSPLGELDPELDALLAESLLADTDLDETKKE
ncbi:hypothetical protein H6G52_06280 [Limnothrix sp. FACHB-881]|uniref:hypothetical protein n=1 Tax=Limnothrix sp. FACHB-881 TaxID=2692819 RepID=UPI001686405F|nr:hypothetical protein [Limnothrix sp. FACHB-881]MBD2634962.1 hypothetical protein [Limnothrix sp. FACHB-881]